MEDLKKFEIDGVTYTVLPKYEHIDESRLSIVDRLGLAYCRLNSYEWDDILGEKPKNIRQELCMKKMMAIQEIIGSANTNRCWWKFELGRTEDEWRAWYYKKHSPEPTANRVDDTRQSSDGKECSSKKLKNLPDLIRSFFFKEK